MPLELDRRTVAATLAVSIFGSKRDRAVQDTLGIGITAQTQIIISELLENVRVLRIELDGALKIFERVSVQRLCRRSI